MTQSTNRSVRIFVVICILGLLLPTIYVPLDVSGVEQQNKNTKAAFGNITLTDRTITYDQPRHETQVFEEAIELTVENEGNEELVLSSITATTGAKGIIVRPTTPPETIPPNSTRTITLRVAADPDLPEGGYPVTVVLEAENENISDASLTTSLTITHETRMRLSSDLFTSTNEINLGNYPIAPDTRFNVTIGEQLGYQNIEDIKIERQEGPEKWLTVVNAPDHIEAGTTETLVFAIQLDPQITLYDKLSWEYTVNGSNVEQQSIQIRLIPTSPHRDVCTLSSGSPPSFTPSTPNSTELVVILDEVEALDDTAYSGTVSVSEMNRVQGFCAATSKYIGTASQVEMLLAEEEYDEARRETVIAVSSLKLMHQAGGRIESDEYREHVDSILNHSKTYLNELVAKQERYHKTRLTSENTSLLEKVRSKRALADFARYRGDIERARNLDSDADEMVERYSNHVAEGEQSLRVADQLWRETESDLIVTVGDDLVLLNPVAYRTLSARTANLRANYSAAEEAFRAVDEDARADRVAMLRRQHLRRIQRAKRGTISIGAISLVFCPIIFLSFKRRYNLF